MKIAHIVCRYPPYYSGMGSVVFALASELGKLGHEVAVFTPNYYQAEEIRPPEAKPAQTHEDSLKQDIDYARRLRPSLRYGNAARLPQLAKELDEYDIVHLHYPFFGTANLVRKWKLRHMDKPLVVTYHMDTRGPGWKGLLFKYYSTFWMPKILAVADRITVSSFDYAAASAARQVFLHDNKKWLELPFGVDTERFFPGDKSPDLLAELGLDPITPTIIFVGAMDAAHYFKGIPVLIEALHLLKKSNTPVQAVFIGDGGSRPRFMAQAAASGLDLLVHFVGAVSDTALPEYYRLADLCVLPSIHQGEAFGMVLLEAFASGLPVVATDIPGVRTVAVQAGLVVPPNDALTLAEAIAGFFYPGADRSSWRARARDVAVNKYAWGPIVEKLEGMYEELVREQGS